MTCYRKFEVAEIQFTSTDQLYRSFDIIDIGNPIQQNKK